MTWWAHIATGPHSDELIYALHSGVEAAAADQIQCFSRRGDVVVGVAGGVVGAQPRPHPPTGHLPRPRALLPPLSTLLSAFLLHSSHLQGGVAVGVGVAGHMGAAAGGGVAVVRVVAGGNAGSVEEEWVHPDRLLRRAQPAATRSM
jgi:hypothetical protein